MKVSFFQTSITSFAIGGTNVLEVLQSWNALGLLLSVRKPWGGGGGFLIIFLGRGVPSHPKNPDPISDENIRFSIPYFRPDSQNVYPISDPVMCCNFGNSKDLWRTGLRDAPNNVRVFSSGCNVICSNMLMLNMVSQTKQTEYTYFRLEMLENDTLWATYLHGLYYGNMTEWLRIARLTQRFM